MKKRITINNDVFKKHQTLLTGKINHNLKKRLIKTLVWSVLLIGSETWMLRRGGLKSLESCEMWIWRRMEKMNWREHVRNEVFRRVGEKRSLKVPSGGERLVILVALCNQMEC